MPSVPSETYMAYQRALINQRGMADRAQERALKKQRAEHRRAMEEIKKQAQKLEELLAAMPEKTL